jgi:putative membrane protein
VDEPVDEARDATRRTRLANERTFLAWWRSGLTAFAVAIGAGKLVPAVADDVEPWPYELLGAGFALLGVAFVVYGWVRQRDVDRALAAGGYAPPGPLAVAAFTAAGVVLGTGTLLVVLLAGG